MPFICGIRGFTQLKNKKYLSLSATIRGICGGAVHLQHLRFCAVKKNKISALICGHPWYLWWCRLSAVSAVVPFICGICGGVVHPWYLRWCRLSAASVVVPFICGKKMFDPIKILCNLPTGQ